MGGVLEIRKYRLGWVSLLVGWLHILHKIEEYLRYKNGIESYKKKKKKK